MNGAPTVPASLKWLGNTMALLDTEEKPMSTVNIPIVNSDSSYPGLMTPEHLAMLSIDETELDTAVTTALSEATACFRGDCLWD